MNFKLTGKRDGLHTVEIDGVEKRLTDDELAALKSGKQIGQEAKTQTDASEEKAASKSGRKP